MALKDKLMTLEDFKAVRDVDVASNSAQFTEIKADLGAQTGIIRLVKDYYINTSTTPISLTPIHSSAGRMSAVVDCSTGDKFVINAYSDSGVARAWCFIDNTNNAISMADYNATVTDLELTAPENAVKLIINDMRGGMSYKVGNNLVSRVSEIEKVTSGLFTDDAKAALLACFAHVAWTDEHGQGYYDALESAIYESEPHWDYEWDASSGVAPVDINGNSATGEFVGGLFKLGVLSKQEFYYANSADAEIELVFACVRKSSGEQFPMFAFCHTFANSKGSGFKLFNNSSGHISISISGTILDTGSDFPIGTDLYTLNAVVTSSGCTCSFANADYSGSGVVNNSYLLGTSIGYPNDDENNLMLKSIKYKYL